MQKLKLVTTMIGIVCVCVCVVPVFGLSYLEEPCAAQTERERGGGGRVNTPTSSLIDSPC